MSSATRIGVSLGRVATTLLVSLIFTTLILLLSGAPPLRTYIILLEGGLGSAAKLPQVIGVWVPLILCSSALLVTFAPGL